MSENQKKNENAWIPIVGIGASAGGLEAFEKFFSNMAPDSGMAFVLVSHLDPDRKSLLTEIITKYTRMNVEEIQDGIEIKKNNTYIIPPNRDLELKEGHLYLTEFKASHGLRLPIDLFFRSLASDQKERSICIILSGTGSDGTIGSRIIKGEQGLVMVQDPKSAKYDGMPRSAINTGTVDYVLPPENMPEKLIDYVKNLMVFEDKDALKSKIQDHEDGFPEIFSLLLSETGYDFSKYKKNTLLRRIQRRMTLMNINNFGKYLNFLKDDPSEIKKLFQDLLIGVTNFFRDNDAFQIISKDIIPSMVNNVKTDEPLRIWVPACSTGEEAYTMAILIQEYLDKNNLKNKFQIFGTDIDEKAIDAARQGQYPDGIRMDVPPEYIKEYFILENKRLKIKKEIRNSIIFAVQNVISDPPFSRLDLICCRNLLIYLTPEIQKELLLLFYYSLNRNGFLFLGNSESISSAANFFSVKNSKWKIYQKNEQTLPFKDKLRHFPPISDHAFQTKMKGRYNSSEKLNYKDLIDGFLLKRYAPSAVMVNDDLEILYFHGQTGKYLEPSEGNARFNIIEMAREGYRLDLKSAIRRAKTQSKEAIIKDITIKTNGGHIHFDLTIIPNFLSNHLEGLVLVLFEDKEGVMTQEDKEIIIPLNEISDNRVKELENELHSTKEDLQTTIEELETSNEEIKSTNEELQSSNEELQSTNEELQTSKEELQSINEELLTVNAELESKLSDLSTLNNDLVNLMASTEIPTIFLNKHFEIRRFTPSCQNIFNLIESDVGRPLHHISHNLKYDSLIQDAKKVMKTLTPLKIDVEGKNGYWYSMKIIVYRTLNDVIDGVTITFFNITKRRIAEQQLKKSEKEYKEAYNLANFYKDLFAHDMNNILQGVLSSMEYFSLFKDDPKKMEKLGDIATVIKNHVKRGIKLISNVRKLSELEESKIKLKPITIKHVIDKTISDLKNSFKDRIIEVEIDGLSEEMKILGDELAYNVFENILNNSIKYNFEEDVVDIHIIVSRVQKDNVNYLKFEIKDFGIGIREERKKVIFMRQFSKDISDRGMGIGLSLVYKIILKYGGEIWVEDRVKGDYSKGTNFIVLLKEAI